MNRAFCRLFIIAVFFIILPATRSRAQLGIDYAWNKSNGGNYAAPGNWTPSGIPDAANEGASFNLASSYQVDVAADYSVGSLTVSQGDVSFYVEPPGFLDPVHVYTAGGVFVDPPAGGSASFSYAGGNLNSNTMLTVGSSGNASLAFDYGNFATAGSDQGIGSGATGHVTIGSA